jgi:hypothetical protein
MNGSRRTSLLFVCFAILIFSSIAVSQNTINVPADQPTIQQGIDATQNGDTVLVAPGTYFENINFHGKNVTLKSSGGRDVTTIDGNNLSSVVTFSSGETSSALLDGFTLTHGFDVNHGGGVTVLNSSPTIQHNVITANRSISGAGVYVLGGSPIIQFNSINNNSQSGGSGGMGGGIYLEQAPDPQVRNNTISRNSLPLGGNGGGIGSDKSAGVIIANFIVQNSVSNAGGGIAVTDGAGGVIVNNLFVENSDSGVGDGITVANSVPGAGPYIINNTFLNNVFLVGYIANVVTENNVVYTTGTKVPFTCKTALGTQLPTISNNDFFSTTNTPNGGLCGGIAGTSGNIALDPRFVNELGGGSQPSATSPAIDAGDNSALGLPASDFSGNSRISDGDNDGTATVDMGAFEYVYEFPHLSYSPDHLDFGPIPVGTTSDAQTITITNDRANVLRISSIRITPTDPGTDQNFAIVSASGNCVALNVGDKCFVSVRAIPAAMGQVAANLFIQSNAGNPALPLTVEGTQPRAGAFPDSLAFGSALIGTTTASQTVFYENHGNAPLNYALSISGDFSETHSCPNPLPAGGECDLNVRFTPTAAGNRTGAIVFTDDAPGSPRSVQLQGTGEAPNPAAQISASSLAFGAAPLGSSSAAQAVTLTSSGNVPLHVAVTISGDYTQTSNCPASLAVGAQCQVSVTFTPSATGARLGTLSFTDDAGNSPQAVSLNGTGVDYLLSMTPSSNVPMEAGRTAYFSLSAADVGGHYEAPILPACYTTAPNAYCALQQVYVTTGNFIGIVLTTTKPQGKTAGTPGGSYPIFVESDPRHRTSATLVIKK